VQMRVQIPHIKGLLGEGGGVAQCNLIGDAASSKLFCISILFIVVA